MSTVQKTIADGRVAGSFRDPSGYVFRRDGRVYRAIDSECFETLQSLRDRGLFESLIDEKLLVRTQFVEDSTLCADLAFENPGFGHFLEHERIATITYPYEWSTSMLADAGIHTIDLQIRLLEAECSLKDATAFNIQFVGSRPTFIDVSSIERPARLDLWFALGQFSRMFIFPLLLCKHHGWDLRSYFLASPNGREVEQVVRAFGRVGRWRPGLLLDVTLPWLLGRNADRRKGSGRELIEKPNRSRQSQLLNLGRVRAKVAKLAAQYKPQGIWSGYTNICNYDDEAERDKKEQVRLFLQRAAPERVLDVGCNTGDYSYLAAECGADVLAIDQDHDAVELLYRRLKEQPASITPAVVDLTNPGPAIGYRNQERAKFTDRLHADCVLALALIHHLLVSGNLSLEAIRDLFLELTDDYLILEYVPTDDNMFQRLMKFRVNLFDGLSLVRCREVFSQGFEIVDEQPVRGSLRTLLMMRKRTK